jgi:DNA modification methylase
MDTPVRDGKTRLRIWSGCGWWRRLRGGASGWYVPGHAEPLEIERDLMCQTECSIDTIGLGPGDERGYNFLQRRREFDHPTQKAIELMRKPILNHLRHGELVS